MSAEKQLLRNISVVDFTMIDLALFLDTHPEDRKALEYFSHYAQIKRKMCAEFSKRFYPLTLAEADCDKSWTWGEAPLPWEGGCD